MSDTVVKREDVGPHKRVTVKVDASFNAAGLGALIRQLTKELVGMEAEDSRQWKEELMALEEDEGDNDPDVIALYEDES